MLQESIGFAYPFLTLPKLLQRNYLDPLLDRLSAQGSDDNAQLNTPTSGFRLVLCVVASNPSLDLSRDTLACCIKVKLIAHHSPLIVHAPR